MCCLRGFLWRLFNYDMTLYNKQNLEESFEKLKSRILTTSLFGSYASRIPHLCAPAVLLETFQVKNKLIKYIFIFFFCCVAYGSVVLASTDYKILKRTELVRVTDSITFPLFHYRI